MNCVYCNQPNADSSGIYIRCYHCFGHPYMPNWDELHRLNMNYLWVSFRHDANIIVFYPQNYKLKVTTVLNGTLKTICYVEVPEIITPQNFKIYFDKIMNMKAFL